MSSNSSNPIQPSKQETDTPQLQDESTRNQTTTRSTEMPQPSTPIPAENNQQELLQPTPFPPVTAKQVNTSPEANVESQ